MVTSRNASDRVALIAEKIRAGKTALGIEFGSTRIKVVLIDDTYETIAFAFPAMACADAQDDGADAVMGDWKDTFKKAPIMAPNMGTSYTCQFWTADSAPQLKLTAKGAPTILVVGTTGDSATPYEQAQTMAEQLDSGVLLTLDGAGHGAVTGDNSCIAEHVDAYLYDGAAPDEGTVCR